MRSLRRCPGKQGLKRVCHFPRRTSVPLDRSSDTSQIRYLTFIQDARGDPVVEHRQELCGWLLGLRELLEGIQACPGGEPCSGRDKCRHEIRLRGLRDCFGLNDPELNWQALFQDQLKSRQKGRVQPGFVLSKPFLFVTSRLR